MKLEEEYEPELKKSSFNLESGTPNSAELEKIL